MSFESTKDEESRLHIREESNNKRIVVISDDSESEYSSLGSLKEDLVPFTQETSSSLPSLTCSSSSSSSTSNNPPLQLLSMTSEISKKLEMKEINITKQVEMIIPESKSSNLFSSLSFSCQVTCTHYLNYRLYIEEDIHYSFADLNKLDIILGSNGSLDIQCSFLLNGLDNVLEYPTWFQRPLNKVMADCGFINDDITEDSKGCLHYKIKKAFVTTPLSYLLDKEAPYGTLGKIEITFDWITTNILFFL
ncbi:MAG: hypothetical protein EXX96DRAFT_536648 [Benjaminiella poitrasii]|nr:MAG: hypothetical protein EXX96DRAFT_536648 [Benjaminiella poitrasii]